MDIEHSLDSLFDTSPFISGSLPSSPIVSTRNPTRPPISSSFFPLRFMPAHVANAEEELSGPSAHEGLSAQSSHASLSAQSAHGSLIAQTAPENLEDEPLSPATTLRAQSTPTATIQSSPSKRLTLVFDAPSPLETPHRSLKRCLDSPLTAEERQRVFLVPFSNPDDLDDPGSPDMSQSN